MSIFAIPRNYPVEDFPITARKAIYELSEHVKAPLGLVALSVLSAMSTVSQANVKVVLPIGGQPKPVSLFVLVVAVSGDRKTAVDNLVFGRIRKYDQKEEEGHERAQKQYQREHRIWSAKERRLIRQIIDDEEGSDDLRAKLEEHHECEPVRPRLRRQLWQNASERAVIDALDGNGESFALIADEGGAVLNSPLFSNAACLNKVWDGGPIIVDRAHSVSLAARDTRVTTSIMVQPSVLQDFVRQHGETLRGSGFFARFLICRPVSLQGSRFLYNPQDGLPELEKFQQEISDFLEPDNPCERVLEFDGDAKQTWINFINQVEADIRPGGCLSEINDFASKVGEIAARVAAIFHYFAKLEGHISTDTLKRAIEVVCYHIDEFRNIFDSTAQFPQVQLDANSIQSYLYRTCWQNGFDCIPRNYVLQNGPVRGKSRFDAALDILLHQGRVWISVGNSKKRFINFNFNGPVSF